MPDYDNYWHIYEMLLNYYLINFNILLGYNLSNIYLFQMKQLHLEIQYELVK